MPSRLIQRAAKAGRALLALTLALAMTLSLLLSSALTPSAFAAVDENGNPVYCGCVAHRHSDACYTIKYTLICGQEETGHHHTDACFTTQQTLVCGQTERPPHHHTEACYTWSQNFICTETDPEHVHTEECYETVSVLSCGQEETEGHTHTPDCWVSEEICICGLEENDGHIHSDACWKQEKVLSCGMTEHEHTLECYSDRSAVETDADWRASVSGAMITGRWAEDLVAVARTQVGYRANSRNYIVRNGNMLYYTRYGDWIDNSESVVYGDWCASFVAFCLYYANIRTVPFSANCATWVKKLIEADMYREYGEIEPKAGDLVFFYSGKEADRLAHKAFHMGIIVETSETGFITIEGNVGPVSYREYSYENDAQILGFGCLPDNPDYRSVAATRGRMTFSGVLPEDTEVRIRALSAEEIERYDLPEGRVIFAFEAGVYSGGKEYKQRWGVSVEIEAPGIPQEGLQVIHIRENPNGSIKERYPVEKLKVSGNTVSFLDFSIARYIAVACPVEEAAEEPT